MCQSPFSGRADNACTNLLGFFVCYVRTRGSMRLRGAVKPPTFALPFASRTCHALLPATNSCTPRWFARRTARVLLADFWYTPSRRRRSEVASPPWTLLLVTQKYDKHKVTLIFFAGDQWSPLLCKNKSRQQPKQKFKSQPPVSVSPSPKGGRKLYYRREKLTI